MKQSTSIKKLPSKGNRLNWTPLKDVKHVQLNKVSIKGREVTSKDVSGPASVIKRKVLVP